MRPMRLDVVGRSRLDGQAFPLDADGGLVAARAVRRALAAARARAVDVETLAVGTPDPMGAMGRRFARRALGPSGETVELVAIATGDVGAERAVEQAIRTLEARALEHGRISVAVGLGTDGATLAMCLRRPSGDTRLGARGREG